MPGCTGRRWSGRGPARCALRASRPDGRRAGVGVSVTCHSVGCGAGQGTCPARPQDSHKSAGQPPKVLSTNREKHCRGDSASTRPVATAPKSLNLRAGRRVPRPPTFRGFPCPFRKAAPTGTAWPPSCAIRPATSSTASTFRPRAGALHRGQSGHGRAAVRGRRGRRDRHRRGGRQRPARVPGRHLAPHGSARSPRRAEPPGGADREAHRATSRCSTRSAWASRCATWWPWTCRSRR